MASASGFEELLIAYGCKTASRYVRLVKMGRRAEKTVVILSFLSFPC